MLTSWANHVVIGALGLGIGMLWRVVLLVMNPNWRAAGSSPRREGESLIDWQRRRSTEQSEAMTPKMMKASLGMIAVVAILVLVVYLSPVELGWWTLWVSIGAGGLLIEGVYRLARSGRLPDDLLKRFDPVPRDSRAAH